MVRVVVAWARRLEEPFGDDPPRPLPADLARLVDVTVHHHPKRGADLLQRLGPQRRRSPRGRPASLRWCCAPAGGRGPRARRPTRC